MPDNIEKDIARDESAAADRRDTAMDRRQALSKIGLLAGGAPMVVMLLKPSESRAEFRGASCVDSNCPDLDPDAGGGGGSFSDL